MGAARPAAVRLWYGHEGDCFVTGFASRKSALTLYITAGVERFPKPLAKLGKHKAGRAVSTSRSSMM